MRVSGTPLTALSLGIEYNVNGWFFEANLNYYDRVYIGFSPYRRLTSTYPLAKKFYTPSVDASGTLSYGDKTMQQKYMKEGGILCAQDGSIVDTQAAEQEKCKGGFMLDASIGKFIRLKKGRSLSINLSLQNITNNTNLRTGGYEQNRDDFYNTGVAKAYTFSKNSKYYYANAFNAFLNVGFKF